MFTETMIALFTAFVLSASFVSAGAQTNGRGCINGDTEEGYRVSIDAQARVKARRPDLQLAETNYEWACETGRSQRCAGCSAASGTSSTRRARWPTRARLIIGRRLAHQLGTDLFPALVLDQTGQRLP